LQSYKPEDGVVGGGGHEISEIQRVL